MHHILSLSDLMLLDSWRTAAKKNDQEEMNRVLYSSGLDTDKPWVFEYCEHRNLQNKIVTCERIVGIERTDGIWLKSGAASEQVRLEVKGDLSLFQELDTLRGSGLRSVEGTYDSKDYED